MKKKEMEIGKNVSSGAEKVELIEKKVKKTKTEPPKKAAKGKEKKSAGATLGRAEKEISTYEKTLGEEKIVAKKINSELSSGKAEAESAAAKARVEAALKKKQAQEKRKEEKAKRKKAKAEAKAKKAAAKKELIEKRAAQRKALQEKRAQQREERIRERAHAKANKKQARAKKEKARKSAKAEKSQRKQRREGQKGYGGWIAAVVSLGVVTLGLATTVTVGAVEMSRSNAAMMSAYKGTMYELTELMENVDEDLDRIRVSNSPAQQSRILTDILVQTRLAELDLEKLPLSIEQDENLTVFINRAAMQSEKMLSKLRNGERLTEEDRAALERMYETNHAARMELDKLLAEATDKDWSMCIKKGQGKVTEALQRLENATLEENRATFYMPNMLNMPQMPKLEMPKKEGEDKKNVPALPSQNQMPGIEAARAEELCKTYFQDYGVKEFKCVGETVGMGYKAHNVQGYTDSGVMLFAEINRADGQLLGFNFYENCSEEKFDVNQCEMIAERFLEKLGYEDMEATRFTQNDGTIDFTFAYEKDDVVYYPKSVRVKVCASRGVVSGLDARKYIANEGTMYEFNAEISLGEAQEKLYKALGVEASRPVVVKAMRGQRSAYEFLCSYDEENYFVYIDAKNGEEIAIVNAKGVMRW